MKVPPATKNAGELVVHPTHYNSHPSGVECIDIIRHMTFNSGSVFKYLWRNGLKDGNPKEQEMRKALFYMLDELYRVTGDGKYLKLIRNV